MIDLKLNFDRPGLLVSVRNDSEAVTAIAAGADVIDVKEPSRGPLGGADFAAIAEVVRVVDGRAMVTAALGELDELQQRAKQRTPVQLPAGVSLFKIGLAGCATRDDWRAEWQAAIDSVDCGTNNERPSPVAVVYADWKSAAAPTPDEVFRAAVDVGCPALLIDTWQKSTGSLFDHWNSSDLRVFLKRVQAAQILAVLAGSLSITSLPAALSLMPDLIAVRGAACDRGRNGAVSAMRVQELKQQIAAHRTKRPPRLSIGRQ